jgi:hypothetical protein
MRSSRSGKRYGFVWNQMSKLRISHKSGIRTITSSIPALIAFSSCSFRAFPVNAIILD